MADDSQIRFIDNPHAPDVYASDISGFFILSGNVVITLESARPDHTSVQGEISRVVVARLVLPAAAAQSLAVGLFDFLSQRGLLPEGQGAAKVQ